MGYVYGLLLFALFEDVLSAFCENPQVTFASLSSPAVMDIRPLRGRFLACGGFKDNRDNRDNIFSLLAHLAIALALHFVACQSKKRANIWGMFTACFCSPSSRTSCLLSVKIRRLRSLRSLHQRLWIFALFEDVSSLAEVLKTIETIGTIFFPCLRTFPELTGDWL